MSDAHCIANDVLFPEVEQMLRSGKEVTLTPTGQSMQPFIRGGYDSVQLALAGKPKVGDILLVRLATGQYVLHRLIRLEDDRLTLRGDGNIAGEEHCLTSDIIARVTAVYTPYGRRKHLTRGRLWNALYPIRRWLLKADRKWQKHILKR